MTSSRPCSSAGFGTCSLSLHRLGRL
jgi:hypothetical protein